MLVIALVALGRNQNDHTGATTGAALRAGPGGRGRPVCRAAAVRGAADRRAPVQRAAAARDPAAAVLPACATGPAVPGPVPAAVSVPVRAGALVQRHGDRVDGPRDPVDL